MRTPTLALCAVVLGCSSDPPAPTDAGRDSARDATEDTADASLPNTREEVPVSATERLAGLDGPVDVVIDRYGWPHIRATTLRDGAYVQGVLAARDRMAQMDILRRLSSGTLAEAFGVLSAGAIESDFAVRTIGFRRVAEVMWRDMPPGRQRTALEAYARGVNAYLAEIRSAAREAPEATDLVVNERTPDWTPVDSLTFGRYQSYALSYDADQDINVSASLDRARMTWETADPMLAPERYARRGWAQDYIRFQPPQPTAIVAGFGRPMGMASTFVPEVFRPRVPRGVYARTEVFFDRLREAVSYLGLEDRGSNNWVVAPTASANGHAMIANDPHLALRSPPVFYGVHLEVTDGPDRVNVAGVTFPGVPGVVIGFNDRVAWGVTTAGYDVTDVYAETLVPGAAGAPDSVRFMGRDVPLQVITERVPNGRGTMVELRVEVVPHHGPLVPTIRDGRVVPRTGERALSVRWTGHQPTNEIGAFVGLMYARSAAEGRTAQRLFGVGAQNFVIADVDGNALYASHAVIPVRSPGARTYDARMNPTGTSPCAVLPGDGTAEWAGELTPEQIPGATLSPALPFVVTANNDQTGTTFDNNPLNDGVHLGCSFASGWRAERIVQRLTMAGPRISMADMESTQNEHTVLLAGRFRPFLQSALGRLDAEWATAGTHRDLTPLAEMTRPRADRLRDAVRRVMAWSLDGASGADYDATDAERRDAVASSIFHAWIAKAVQRTFSDELSAMGGSFGNRLWALLYLLEHPMEAATRDPMTNESVLFDDLTTTGARESRDHVLLLALDQGLAELQRLTMTDTMDRWLWGNLHTVRFSSFVPGPGEVLSIPPSTHPMFPRGFPRPGGLDVVDASDPGLSGTSFSYGNGPVQRFVVELDPAGPRAFNALPGGQHIDLRSPHHADEAELWRTNRRHPVPFLDRDVARAAERRMRFMPQ
ncbi:MAG: penicillin acylase family protein [Deltaproteobacteria bacterium]|nr:penicillin acylase family protein [Deltaproteobacteria bacterium]